MPGSAEFVAGLVERGVPCAVVSSSPRENIDVVLARGGQRRLFRTIVAAEDTRASKPDPEGFLLGAARLDLPPERCVVFEDAPAGIQAGLAGGMRVVALSTTHPASELGAAHLQSASLGAELVPGIERWF